MAVFTQQITVTSTATALTNATNTVDGRSGGMSICNRGSASVFLGGVGVTTATGFQLDVGQTFSADPASGWFAIAASGSHRVDVLSAVGISS